MIDRRRCIGDAIVGVALSGIAMPGIAWVGKSTADLLQADIDRYDSFGVHRTGSAADHRTTQWLGRHLERLGFAVDRLPFAADLFDVARSILVTPAGAVPVVAQAPFPTERLDLNGGLANLDSPADLRHGIALARFPYSPDASLGAAPYATLIEQAAARGAAALIAVTEGPTGDVIRFNTPPDRKPTPLPVLLVAPRNAHSIAAGLPVRIDVVGRHRRSAAYTTIGRLDRGGPRIVVSTPQSGWTHAAGERGPGLALWRALAATAAQSDSSTSYLFLASSGHEVGHAGLKAAFDRLGSTLHQRLALWLHLGANLATFDYDRSRTALRLLPTPNPNRGVGASRAVLAQVQAAFRDMSSLPVVDLAKSRIFGEVAQIAQAGYEPVVGLIGSGVFHHVERDRASLATSGRIVAPLLKPLERLISAAE